MRQDARLRRDKFCSETCAGAFHPAITAKNSVTLSPAGAGGAASGKSVLKHGDPDKSRRHLALRRAWIAEHATPAG
jgi:hypothetical protein